MYYSNHVNEISYFLKRCQLCKIFFWVTAWRWTCEKAETCSGYNFLIIFYLYLNNKVVLDCKIIYTELGMPHLNKTPILVTFVKQRAAEQNSHQHSNYMICFFKFSWTEINFYEALYVCWRSVWARKVTSHSEGKNTRNVLENRMLNRLFGRKIFWSIRS